MTSGFACATDATPAPGSHRRSGLRDQSTIGLADMAKIARGERVIDIGSGLGGQSRYLAATYDCEVLGVDLSPSFVSVANYLAVGARGSPAM